MSIDHLPREGSQSPDEEYHRATTIDTPNEIEHESSIYDPDNEKGYTTRKKIAVAAVAATATLAAIVGGAVTGKALAGHDKRPSTAAPANPGEHHPSAETDPTKWTEENVPMRDTDGKLQTGVDQTAKAISLTAEKDPTAVDAAKDLFRVINWQLNYGNTPQSREEAAGYVSKDRAFKGAEGVAYDFASRAAREALTTPESSVHVQNLLSGITAGKVAVDRNYDTSNSGGYREEYTPTTVSDDGATGKIEHVTVGLDYSDNFRKTGGAFGEIKGDDVWHMSLTLKDGVWKAVDVQTEKTLS